MNCLGVPIILSQLVSTTTVTVMLTVKKIYLDDTKNQQKNQQKTHIRK